MIRIFLDDERVPKKEKFTNFPKNYADFCSVLYFAVEHGIKIQYVSFDHDLGEPLTGYDCAKVLCQFDMDHQIMAHNFEFNVHSANPPGRKNIEMYMDNYLKFAMLSLRQSPSKIRELFNKVFAMGGKLKGKVRAGSTY